MHPREHAAKDPHRPAVIMAGSGKVVSYGDLVERSNRLAQVLHGFGLRHGDHVAILLDNDPRYFELLWASQNNGQYFTTLSTHLTAPEIAFILKDAGVKAVVTSNTFAERVAEARALVPALRHVLNVDGAAAGMLDYEKSLAAASPSPLGGETQGALMLYSSGTTGFPKGIKPALPDLPLGEPAGVQKVLIPTHGLTFDTIYLSPAPLYHTAPLKWNMTMQMVGARSVVLDRFDAEATLEAIEKYRVTHAQFVPTMFVRMLKLPDEVRTRYDLSSLRRVIHAAAPCPVEVKERMIEWLGPIVEEYYAGTESNGLCVITADEWLKRKGSVGRSVRGPIHIMDETGEIELPTGEPGLIYFEGGTPFVYHGDPEKTAKTRNSRGWSAIGDIGYVDADGYLYLTDRKDDVIISGGVNIYPQEAESLLITHPKVYDVAVLGVPNPDFGEEVKAVVQPMEGVAPGPELVGELQAWLEGKLAHYKRPRSYDFVDALPRLPTGKLLKRVLRERYWGTRSRPQATLAERIGESQGRT